MRNSQSSIHHSLSSILSTALSLLLLLTVWMPCRGQDIRVGDLVVNRDRSRGIVFWVSPDGSQGWMVAMQDPSLTCQWGTNGDIPTLFNYDDRDLPWGQCFLDTAGYTNTLALRQYQHNLNFASGQVDFDNGWYLPSAGQMLALFSVSPMLDTLFPLYGGIPLGRDLYWCSAEYSSNYAIAFNFRDGLWEECLKQMTAWVRPIRNFSAGDFVLDTTLSFRWNTGDTATDITATPDSSTRYTVTVTTAFGCTTSAEHAVLVASAFPQHFYDTVCQGTPYSSGGFALSADETAQPGWLCRTDTFYLDSCSVLSSLHLYVAPSQSDTVDSSFCAGSSFLYNGHTYIDTGLFPLPFATTLGCDSVVNLHLSLRYPSSSELHRTVADFDLPFSWRGHLFWDADTQQVRFSNVAGCDSVVNLVLDVRTDIDAHLDTLVCVDRLPLLWHGIRFTEPGDIVLYLTSSQGTDSLVLLTVEVGYPVALDTIVVACDSFLWNGMPYTVSDTLAFHHITAAGCDSTIRIDLRIAHDVEASISDTFCTGTPYRIGDSLYSRPGLYHPVIRTSLGCDSLVTLSLVELPPPSLTLIETYSCTPPVGYTLTPILNSQFSTLNYHLWSSMPEDPALNPFDSVAVVNPRQPTTYTFTADYRSRPLCPVSDSLVLSPIVPIVAQLRYLPDQFDYDHLVLSGYDLDTTPHRRQWYLDGYAYGDTAAVTYRTTLEADSVTLFLVVENELCHDTAFAVVPMRFATLYFPNIFTPDLSVNNRFRAYGTGVSDYQLWIFSRTGQQLFHTSHITDGWDGTSHGIPCQQGTYTYKCRYRDRTQQGFHTAVGTVTLVR